MKEFTTKNGAEVKINDAPFQDAFLLKNEIQKSLAEAKLDIKIDDNVESLLKAFLLIDSNEKVNQALFKCLARCLYNNLKINQDLFEDTKIREDYYEIVLACLEVNILPFFKSLFSKLGDLKTMTLTKTL